MQVNGSGNNSYASPVTSDSEEEDIDAILDQLIAEINGVEQTENEVPADLEQRELQTQVYTPECNVAENHWLGLTKDVAIFLFGTFDFTYYQLGSLSLTCKAWYLLVQNNRVGIRLLKKVGMLPRLNEPWLKTYNLWFTCKNYFIALDVSGSMNEPFQGSTRLQCGIDMVKEIASRVLPIAYRGLYVVIFSDEYLVSHTRTPEEVHKLLENIQVNQGGTDILKVFQEIFAWHKNQGNAVMFGHPVRKPTLTNVYLISDLEIGYNRDIEEEIEEVYEEGVPMAFHCYQMGSSAQGQEFAGRLMEYNREEDTKISCIYKRTTEEDPDPEFVDQDWFGGFADSDDDSV